MVDRYVAGAVGRPFLGVVVLLVGVFVAYSLARFLGEANEGLLSAQAVMRLAALKTVIALEVLLPIALYIGCIVGLGRLYSDWEVVAFRAGGVAETRLMLPAMLLATVIALCTLLLCCTRGHGPTPSCMPARPSAERKPIWPVCRQDSSMCSRTRGHSLHRQA
ncbi:MAG: LptF/LptG family permease [Pseudomonadales bacterium]